MGKKKKICSSSNAPTFPMKPIKVNKKPSTKKGK